MPVAIHLKTCIRANLTMSNTFEHNIIKVKHLTRNLTHLVVAAADKNDGTNELSIEKKFQHDRGEITAAVQSY